MRWTIISKWYEDLVSKQAKSQSEYLVRRCIQLAAVLLRMKPAGKIACILLLAAGCATGRFPSEIKIQWQRVEPQYTMLNFAGQDRRLTVTFTFEPNEIRYSGTNYHVFVRLLPDGAAQAFGIEPFYTWVIPSHIISEGITNIVKHKVIVDGQEHDLVEVIRRLSVIDTRFELRPYEK